ncbi:hypothetical protein RFI_34286, partial [Reticulomyxa filosa]
IFKVDMMKCDGAIQTCYRICIHAIDMEYGNQESMEICLQLYRESVNNYEEWCQFIPWFVVLDEEWKEEEKEEKEEKKVEDTKWHKSRFYKKPKIFFFGVGHRIESSSFSFPHIVEHFDGFMQYLLSKWTLHRQKITNTYNILSRKSKEFELLLEISKEQIEEQKEICYNRIPDN